jgi:tetratricopeptide (TPR) repeat protein
MIASAVLAWLLRNDSNGHVMIAGKIKFNILSIVIALALLAMPSYASDLQEKTRFTPCQYTNTYEYYMHKGEAYLANNNYESAIECFERALIIKHNEKDAQAKLIRAKESLSGKKTIIQPIYGRDQAIEEAISHVDYTSRRPRADIEPEKPSVKVRAVREESATYTKAWEPKSRQVSSEAPAMRRATTQDSQRIVPDYPGAKKQQDQVRYITEESYKESDVERPREKIAREPVLRRPASRPQEQAMDYSQRVYEEEKRPWTQPEKKPAEPEKKPAGPELKYPSITEKRPQAEPEPERRPAGPVLKYPSAISAPVRATPVTTKELVREPFECEFPFFEDFSNGFNQKIQQGTDNINSNIAPSSIRGEYRIAFGATEDDFIWKDANAEYHNMPGDTSWRYLWGRDRHNTYDKKIYSRLKVDGNAHITDTVSGFAQMVIDPWTFVGRKKVSVPSSQGTGDRVDITYKYWSNARTTIDEIYRTEVGDIVSVRENKIIDGKTSGETYSGLDFGGWSNTFYVPEVEIDRMYVPIRKLWVEYDKEPYKAKVFAMADQEEALTSDDPMRLSNNKIWWEESPWLDSYDESRVFRETGRADWLKKGQWIRNLSFMARDSEDTRLTFLRGASLIANFENGASMHMVAATPRNLWDTYEQASSIPAALRVQTPVTDRFTLGGLYTFKGGVYKQSLEAMNNMGAIDGEYQLFNNTQLFGQFAVSNMRVDEASGYKTDYTGYAGSLGLKNQGTIGFTNGTEDRYELRAMYASMDRKFFPGLSNYRLTRKEFEFAKHIYFDEINPENQAVMFGDGMDVGRNAFVLNTIVEFPELNLDGKFDFRTVYNNSNRHIEDAYRLEGTHKTTDKLTLKALAFYKRLPKTKQGIDPLINAKNSYSAFTDYFAYDDVWLENIDVEAGKDPSIGAFSAGLKYDFTDYFTGEGIYESTNDPKDFPRGLLNNVYLDPYFHDGQTWDRIVPFLWGQSSFGLPPYKYYNIYKSRFIYYPFEPVKITLRHTYNDNKYAMATDENATSQGIEIEYKPCPRTTLGFMYQYTRQRDLYRQVPANEGYNFDGHHNIFASFDYQLNQDQHLRIMYGNYVGYDYTYPEDRSGLPALDTRHIVRFVYTGTFGPSDEQSERVLTSGKPNALGPLNPAIPGATFVTKLSGGWARYKEKADIAPVESDWDHYLLRLDLGLDAYDREYWEGGLNVGLFTTLTDTEQWDYDGIGRYQTNDMSFRGADINANIGWAISDSSKYIAFTPLINAGYRRVQFSRDNISTTATTVSALGEVHENFNISYAGIGGRIDMGPINNINFYTSGYWAPLIYAPINNSALGRVNCDRGVIWHAEGGIDYALSDRFDMKLGGFWDLQHLKKAQRIDNGIVNFEMPDNKLETFGLSFGGQYRF